MAREYSIVGVHNAGALQVFGSRLANSTQFTGLLNIYGSAFQCCGATTLQGFHNALGSNVFAERAAFLAGLWQTVQGMRHYVYILADYQLQYTEHLALVECGSVKVAHFRNMQPGHTTTLHMFVVDLNMGIGKFFDSSGRAFTEPPKETPPARAHTVCLMGPTVPAEIPKAPVPKPVAPVTKV